MVLQIVPQHCPIALVLIPGPSIHFLFSKTWIENYLEAPCLYGNAFRIGHSWLELEMLWSFILGDVYFVFPGTFRAECSNLLAAHF